MQKISLLLIVALCSFFHFDKTTTGANKKTIIALFAHPDDEIDVSPALAKYARQGHTVYLVFATRGENGFSKRIKIPQGDSLAGARTQEAICNCEKLGIQPPVFLDLEDGGLGKDFTGRPVYEKLDSIFRLYKPDVVITWGADGGYGHIDHLMISNVATEIFQSGKSTYPKTLYYTGIPTEHYNGFTGLQTEDAKWMYINWKPIKKEFLTVRIPCARGDVDKALKAMDCYASQFTDAEMEDNHRWLARMNNDTVYLQPFVPRSAISYDLFAK